jgi:hypothetical protein
MTGTNGHRKPPEGVLAGESVPVENDRAEIAETRINEFAAELKMRSAYRHLNTNERQKTAEKKLKGLGYL